MSIKLILNNPFRLIGITTTSSMREFQERLDELEAYKAIGKYPTYDYDFSFFDKFVRNDNSLILSKKLVSNKVLLLRSSLFWFSKSDEVDKMALDSIKIGKFSIAKEIWMNSSFSYSYTKNLALFLLLESLLISKNNRLNLLSLSIEKWIELCSNDNFNNLYKELFKEQKSEYFILDLIMGIIKPYFYDPLNTEQKIYNPKIFFDEVNEKKVGKKNIEYLKKIYLLEINNIVNTLYEDHNHEIENTSSKIHLEYLNKISKHINFIREIYKNDLKNYKIICDKVASQLEQCSITLWNENINNIKKNDFLYSEIKKIKNFALKIAVSNSLVQKIKEGFKIHDSVFKQKDEEKEMEKIIKPLNPFLLELEQLEQLEQCDDAHELKQKIYNNKYYFSKIKHLLNHDKIEIVNFAINLLKAFSLRINYFVVNDIGYNKSIELLDMCRRINRTLGNKIIDDELEELFVENRKINLSNINHGDGSWIEGLIGGAVRTVKKNTFCGCGNDKYESECCSVKNY